MHMPKFLRKWRRDRLRDKIIVNGRRLRRAQASRAGIDGVLWPHDAEYLDSIITNLERRHDRLLTQFKES